MTPPSVRRALLSVSDKTGLVELAQALEKRGVEILSTGGTAGGNLRLQEPASPNCFSFLRSVPRLMPRIPAARLWLPSA